MTRDDEALRVVAMAHRRHLLLLALFSFVGAVPLLASGLLIARAVDDGFLAGDPAVGIALLVVSVVGLILGAIADSRALLAAAAPVETLRDRLVERAVRAAVRRATGVRARRDASGVSRIVEQTEQVRQLTGTLLMSVASVGLAFVASVVGLLLLAPTLAGAIFLALAVGGVTLSALSRVWRRRYARSLEDKEHLAESVREVVGGARDILACGAVGRATTEFRSSATAAARSEESVAIMSAARVATIGLSGRMPLVVLLVAGPALVTSGALSAGDLVGAATYIVFGLEPALRAAVQVVEGVGLELAMLLRRIDSGETGIDTGERVVTDSQERERAMGGPELSAERVVFRYGQSATPALDRVSLTVWPGEHIAILGPSGIGKSTLAGVLAGVEQPHEGIVRLGRTPVEEIAPGRLRQRVLLVPQQAYVFAGTVRENIAYLAPDATDDDLDRACVAVGAEDLVTRLGGYDSVVERPGALSSGERQLVVAARVHVAGPEIVILDEATCHLPPEGERRVEFALAQRAGSLVVIAHRISSALRARRIVVFDREGVRSGTHDDLLRDSCTYAELVGELGPPAPSTSPLRTDEASPLPARR